MGRTSKVAFLSVLGVAEERKESRKQEGLADYIMKPFTKKELKERVGALLQKR